MQELVKNYFRSHFGVQPSGVARAPGRVNLIGEHTDYNDGFVLPMAIERAVWIAFEPTGNEQVEIHSQALGNRSTFQTSSFAKDGSTWIEYVKGVADALREAGVPLKGWRGVVASDVPVGSGLSSSAAIELAVATVFTHLAGVTLPASRLARIGQQAENRWVGVNCGIMDQLASAAGRDGHALLIDCRTLDLRTVPLGANCRVVVMDTGTRRQLQHSAYNNRREACESAARHFGRPALRDVRSEELAAARETLGGEVFRRCRHVVTENERTARAANLLEVGKTAEFGRLMDESHESLRTDFEVSSGALDLMVGIARKQPGCLGARMTGAGFGGCAVALVENPHAEAFISNVTQEYDRSSGHSAALFATRATDGAGLVPD